ARLADDGLSAGERVALATGMLSDVLAALRRCDHVDDVVVVTGEPGAAAVRGIEWALADGAFAVLLVASDTPALDPGDVDRLLDSTGDEPEVVVVPDRHGEGTNALLLQPPDVIRPAFGEGSRERHESLARAAGVKVTVFECGSLGLDVDTVSDLHELASSLEPAAPETATHTRAVLARQGR
ncbi:MAG: NTP transferase domain-containing protein, partial [Solirubrobacterales bacterium]